MASLFSDIAITTIIEFKSQIDDQTNDNSQLIIIDKSYCFSLLKQYYSNIILQVIERNEYIHDKHLKELFSFNKWDRNRITFLSNNPFPDNDSTLVFLKVLKYDGKLFKFASSRIRKDKQMILTAIKGGLNTLECIDEELKRDREFVKEVIRIRSRVANALQYLDKFQDDEEICRLAVKADGACYESVSERFRNDITIIRDAVERNSGMIRLVPHHLIDREMVVSALKDGSCFRYIPSEYKNDPQLILKAAKYSTHTLPLIPNQDLLKDRSFALELVKQNGACIEFLSEDFKNDREFAKYAVKDRGVYEMFSDEFKQDRELAIKAVKSNVHNLNFVPLEFRHDREFLRACIKSKYQACSFIRDGFWSSDDKEFAFEIIESFYNYTTRGFNVHEISNDREILERFLKVDSGTFKSLELFHSDKSIVREFLPHSIDILKSSTIAVRGDIEIIRNAIRLYDGALEFASDDLRNDKELVKEAIYYDTNNYKFASENLRNDREITESVLLRNGDLFQFASETLRNDKNLAILALRNSKHNISQFIGYELKKDREIALECAKRYPCLDKLSIDFAFDREIVQEAILKYGSEFKYACESLRNDRSLELIAISTGLSLKDIKSQQDREIVLCSVKHNGQNLQFVNEEFKNDEEITLTAMESSNGNALEFASERFKSDKNLIRKYIKTNEGIIQHISKHLLSDLEFIKEILLLNGLALQFLSKEMKSSRELVLLAVQSNGKSVSFADRTLYMDEEILKVALQNGLKFSLRFGIKCLDRRDIVLIIAKTDPLFVVLPTLARNKEFRKDREIIQHFLSNDLKHLDYISSKFELDRDFLLQLETKEFNLLDIPYKFRKDREIVLKALKNHGKSFNYISSNELKMEISKDRNILLESIQSCDGFIFLCASNELQQDETFIEECISINGMVLRFLPEKYRNNLSLLLKAVENNENSLKFASNNLISNKELILHAVKHFPNSLKYATYEMRNDKDIVMEAIRIDPNSIIYASSELQNSLQCLY